MTAVSKNLYFDMLGDIVYNNRVHRSIKMKPTDVTPDSYAEYSEYSSEKILNLKSVVMLEFQNTKTLLLKDTIKIGQKMFLL